MIVVIILASIFLTLGIIVLIGKRDKEKPRFMACNPDFVQYIIDQCSGAGEIAGALL